MIKYVLDNGREFRDYVVPYTNAATILRDDLKDTEDLEDLFSGWDPEKKAYSPETWDYGGSPSKKGKAAGHHEEAGGHSLVLRSEALLRRAGKDRGGEADELSVIERDPTLEHPRCVFPVLPRHFSRCTPALVEPIYG